MSDDDRTAEDRYVGERERAELAASERRRTEGLDENGDGVDDRRERVVREPAVGRTERTGVLPVTTEGTAARPVGTAGEPVAVVGVRPHVGINWGAGFFGWVAAMGLAVILTALAAAIGAAIGVTKVSSVSQAADQLTQNSKSMGIVSGIVLAVIVFVAYYCGGYVAGRMSRFEGARQGFAVWVWAVIVAVVVAIVAAVAGAKYDVLSSLNSFPRLPVKQGDLTTGGIIALVGLLVTSLLGALLGGRAGMHYHRQLEAYDPALDD